MCVEVAVGIVADSLALLSDAAHMLTDAGALALSLVAIRLARRPAAGAMTYGLKRTEILAAAINGSTLLVLGVLIVYEGIRRLSTRPRSRAAPVLDRRDPRHRGESRRDDGPRAREPAVAQHRGRLPAHPHRPRGVRRRPRSPAPCAATGFGRADGIAALFVAALMLRAAWMLLLGVRPRVPGGGAARARPAGDRPPDGGHAGVAEVHDLHMWEVTSGFPSLSAHVLVGRNTDCHDVRRTLEAMLHDEFEIDHTTLQVEHEGGELLEIEVSPRG